MDDATRLYNRVFFALTGTWADTYSFRRLVHAGVEEAERRLLNENARWFGAFIDDPTNDKVFLDKAKYLEMVGGRAAVAERLTEQAIKAYQGSVDAASLVFMHSSLDSAAHDLCRVTALVDPKPWRSFIANQQERLAVLGAKGYDAVVSERLTLFVEALSYQSLITKTDRLFQVCQPDRSYSRKDYRFDKERLKALDRLRHDIVHGDRPRAPIDDIVPSIDFMHETGLYFFGMVNHRYDLRLDPAYVHDPKNKSDTTDV